jgi:hypothetical protein
LISSTDLIQDVRSQGSIFRQEAIIRKQEIYRNSTKHIGIWSFLQQHEPWKEYSVIVITGAARQTSTLSPPAAEVRSGYQNILEEVTAGESVGTHEYCLEVRKHRFLLQKGNQDLSPAACVQGTYFNNIRFRYGLVGSQHRNIVL